MSYGDKEQGVPVRKPDSLWEDKTNKSEIIAEWIILEVQRISIQENVE